MLPTKRILTERDIGVVSSNSDIRTQVSGLPSEYSFLYSMLQLKNNLCIFGITHVLSNTVIIRQGKFYEK